jgi:carboxyl-terminal processing protease
MAKASWTSIGVVIALGLSLIHPMGAVAKTAAAPAFDDELEQGYVEVPIESIQQFVQIYGLVKVPSPSTEPINAAIGRIS